MKLEFIKGDFSVCKLHSAKDADLSVPYTFIGRTDSEISLVCPSASVPSEILAEEPGWSMFRVIGQLDFSLVGILSKITSVLADNGVSVFAVSTFDTDYILVRTVNAEKTRSVLSDAGYVWAE